MPHAHQQRRQTGTVVEGGHIIHWWPLPPAHIRRQAAAVIEPVAGKGVAGQSPHAPDSEGEGVDVDGWPVCAVGHICSGGHHLWCSKMVSAHMQRHFQCGLASETVVSQHAAKPADERRMQHTVGAGPQQMRQRPRATATSPSLHKHVVWLHVPMHNPPSRVQIVQGRRDVAQDAELAQRGEWMGRRLHRPLGCATNRKAIHRG